MAEVGWFFADGDPGHRPVHRGSPDTTSSFDTRLATLTAWVSTNQPEGVADKVEQVELSVQELETSLETKLRELSATVYVAQAGGTSGFESQGFQGAPPQTRDRNPRDYKIAELGAKPPVARWKKWRQDLEGFVDTIGIS